MYRTMYKEIENAEIVRYGRISDVVWIIFKSENIPDDYYWYWMFSFRSLFEVTKASTLEEWNLLMFVSDVKSHRVGLTVFDFETEAEALRSIIGLGGESK